MLKKPPIMQFQLCKYKTYDKQKHWFKLHPILFHRSLCFEYYYIFAFPYKQLENDKLLWNLLHDNEIYLFVFLFFGRFIVHLFKPTLYSRCSPCSICLFVIKSLTVQDTQRMYRSWQMSKERPVLLTLQYGGCLNSAQRAPVPVTLSVFK